MKKLKLKLQELTNPAILTRQQLRNVMGGDTGTTGGIGDYRCYAYVWRNGVSEPHEIVSAPQSCSSMQTLANNVCVAFMSQTNPPDRCTYDCGCDGWGS